jgi:hypothetical protein
VTIHNPKPGLVVRFDYLWSREHAAGRSQGKDRPACLVAGSDDPTRPRFVILLPITHTPPAEGIIGIEIPIAVKRAIGLDDTPSWVIVTDYNVDEWPSRGLSPIPGQPGTFAYGFIPPGLFAKIKATFLEVHRTGATTGVHR